MNLVHCTSQLYYKPFATIAIVLLVVVVSIIAMVSPDGLENFSLAHDKGINPVQWLSNVFVQKNALHLAFYAAVLAPICVLIEGKLGAAKFVPVFLLVAISCSAIEQVVMRGDTKPAKSSTPAATSTTGTGTGMTAEEAERIFSKIRQKNSGSGFIKEASLGGSSTLFGLIAIAVLWAPSAILGFGKEEDQLTFPLMGFVVVFGLWTGIKCFLTEFNGIGHPIQFIGVVPGIVFGVVLLVTGQAKTDGDDLLAQANSSEGQKSRPTKAKKNTPEILRETPAQRKAKALKEKRERERAAKEHERLLLEAELAAPEFERPTRIDPAMELIRDAIQDKAVVEAVRLLNDVSVDDIKSLEYLEREEYDYLSKIMLKNKALSSGVMVLEKSLLGQPDEPNERRLLLAEIYLLLEQPDKCRTALAKVNRADFAAEEQTKYRQLVIRLRETEAA